MITFDISVIIPTCNRISQLEQAIRSVAAAVHSTPLALFDPSLVEIVIVDDAHQSEVRSTCTDLSVELRMNIKYLTTKDGPRAGPSSARNEGVRNSSGSLIFLLDDDDCFLPNRFLAAIPCLSTGKFDVVLEVTRREYSDGSNRPARLTGPNVNTARLDPFEYLLNGGEDTHITPGATAFSRVAYLRAGGWNQNLRYGEDGEFLLRLACNCRVALLPGAPVAVYYYHSANTTLPGNCEHWQVMLSLRTLYYSVHRQLSDVRHRILIEAIQKKLDYQMTQIRLHEQHFSRRYLQGLKVLRFFPFRLLSLQNIKSIVVWLIKPNPLRTMS